MRPAEYQPSQRVTDAWDGIQPDARNAQAGEYILFRVLGTDPTIYGCGAIIDVDHAASSIHVDARFDDGSAHMGIVVAMRDVTAVLDAAHGTQIIARYTAC